MKTYLKQVYSVLLYFGITSQCAAQTQTTPCNFQCVVVSAKKVDKNYQLPDSPVVTEPKPKDPPAPEPKVKKSTSISSFDRFLNENLSKYDNNVVVTVCNDTMVYNYQNGIYGRDERLPIASCAKWLTGATIMTLVEAGKLNLGDKVSKYIPSFAQNDKSEITIRQIFSHTSGLIADSPYDFASGTLAEAVDNIALNTSLSFRPGTSEAYSSASFKVASRVAEIVEGKSWAQIFKERITDKCGMSNTDYPTENPHTGAWALSTMNDYLKFLEMMHNYGKYKGVVVLSQASIQEMEKDQSNGINSVYGLGMWRFVIVNNTAQEVAGLSARGVHGWVNREKKYFGLIFTQAGFDNTINPNQDFRSLVRNTF